MTNPAHTVRWAIETENLVFNHSENVDVCDIYYLQYWFDAFILAVLHWQSAGM